MQTIVSLPPLACSFPASRTESVTSSVVEKVYRDSDSAAPTISTAPERTNRNVTTKLCRNLTYKTLPVRDKQTRLFTSPVVTKRKRKFGHAGFCFVCGFKVGLITVTKRLNRLVISAIKANLPWRLQQKAIGDAGVILNDKIGARKNHRARLLELTIMQQVRCRLKQRRSRPVLGHPIQKAGIELQRLVSCIHREIVYLVQRLSIGSAKV